jgi:hypothetical protein
LALEVQDLGQEVSLGGVDIDEEVFSGEADRPGDEETFLRVGVHGSESIPAEDG